MGLRERGIGFRDAVEDFLDREALPDDACGHY